MILCLTSIVLFFELNLPMCNVATIPFHGLKLQPMPTLNNDPWALNCTTPLSFIKLYIAKFDLEFNETTTIRFILEKAKFGIR